MVYDGLRVQISAALLCACVALNLACEVFAQPFDVPLSTRDLEIRERYQASLVRDPFQLQSFDRTYQTYLDGEGVDSWIETLEENDSESSSLILLGRVYARRLKTTEAIARFEKARDLGANGEQIDWLLGKVYADAGRYGDAIPLLSAAADALSDDELRAKAIRLLGDAHNRLGDRDKAIAAWTLLADTTRDDAFARWDLAGIYEDYALWAEAAAAYDDIAKQSLADPYARCRALRAKASALLHLDEIDEAIATLEAALGLASPGNWLFQDLKQQLIAVYESRGDLDGLAKYVAVQVDATPTSIEYRALLADVYARLNNIDAAESEYRALLERAPNNLVAYTALIRLYKDADRTEDAAETLRVLADRYPRDTDLVRQLGELYWEAGDKTRAVEAWRSVLDSDDGPRRHAELSGWLAAHDFVDEAIAELNIAIMADQDRGWLFRLAELQVERGDDEDAIISWRATLSSDSTVSEITEVGRLLESNDFIEEAESLFVRAIDMDPNHHESRHALAALLVRAERDVESVPHFERLANADDSEYWRFRGERGLLLALRALGSLDEKQHEWEEAVKSEPNSILNKTRLARLHESRGNYIGGAELYRACVALEPGETSHREALARAYFRGGRYAQSAETYRALLEDQPSRARGYLRELLTVYRRLNNHVDAVTAAERVVELAPSDAAARIQLAEVYLSQGRSDDAFLQFRHAIRSEPDQPSLRLLYGEALTKQRRFADARDTFQGLLERSEDRGVRLDCLRRLAAIHMELNSFDELTRTYERRIRATPNRLEVYAELAAIYTGADRPVDALEALEPAYARIGEPALHMLLNLAFDANDLPKTIEYTEALLTQSGTPDVQTLVRLGRAYADLGDLDTAQITWARIRQAYPDDPKAMASEADALLDHGFFEEALDLERAALEIDPFDSRLRVHFAEHLAEQGDYNAAIKQYFAALDYGESPGRAAVISSTNSKRGIANFRMQIVQKIVGLAGPFDVLDTVIEQFERARTENSESQTARNDLIAVYETLNRTADVIVLAEEALQTQPNDTALIQKLAILYAQSRRFDDAAQRYLQLAEIEPSRRREILIRAAATYKQGKNIDAALAVLEPLHTEMSSDYQIALQLANAYGESGKMKASDALYLELRDPTSDFWQPEATAKLNARNPLQVAHAQQSVDNSWASYLEQNDRNDEARLAYELMLTRDYDASFARGTHSNVHQVSGHGRMPHLVDLRTALQRLFPSVPYPKGNAASKLVELGVEIEIAIEEALGRLEETDQSALTLQKIQLTSQLLSHDETAAEAIDALLQENPEDLELYNTLLMVHEQQFDFEAVMRTYDRMLQAFPQHARPIEQGQYSAALQEGDFTRVATMLEARIANGAPNTSTVQALQSLHQMGGKSVVEPILDQILKQPQVPVNALLLSARIRVDQGDANGAIELARNAFDRAGHSRAGSNTGARQGMANQAFQTLNQLYAQAGRRDEFLAEVRAKVEAKPRSLIHRRRLAEVYMQNGELEKSIEQYEIMLEQRPRDTQMMLDLASNYMRARKTSNAFELYKKLMTSQPAMYRRVYNQMFQLELNDDQKAELAAIEDRVIQRSTNANDIINIAQQALQLNDTDRAVMLFKRALIIDPKNVQAHGSLAGAYASAKDYEGAQKAFHAMVEATRSNDGANLQLHFLQPMAAVYAKLDALPEFAALADSFGETKYGALAKAQILSTIARQEKRYEDAIQHLRDGTESERDHRFVWPMMQLAKDSDNPALAIEILEQAAKSNPRSHYWQEIAQQHIALGNKEQAAEAWSKHAKMGNSIHDYSHAFKSMARAKMFSEAEAFYVDHQKILRRPQMAQSVEQEVIRAYVRERAFEELIHTELLTHSNPRLNQIADQIAQQATRSGGRAETLMDKALILTPNNLALLRRRAQMLERVDDHKSAISFWKRVIALQPDNMNDRQQYARALSRDNRRDEAAAMLAKWVEARPTLDRVNVLVGYLKPANDATKYREVRDRIIAMFDTETRKPVRTQFAPLDAQVGESESAAISLRDQYEEKPDGDSFRAYFLHEFEYGSLANASAILAGFIGSDKFSAQRIPVNQAMTAGFRTGNTELCNALLAELITMNDYNLSNALREAAEVYQRYGAYWRFEALLQADATSSRPAFVKAFEDTKQRYAHTSELDDSALERIARLDTSNVMNVLAGILHPITDENVLNELLKEESALPDNPTARQWIRAFANHRLGNTAKRDEALDVMLEDPDDWTRIPTALMLLQTFEEHERIVSILETYDGRDTNILRERARWLASAYVAVDRHDDAVALWSRTNDQSGVSLGRQLIEAKAYTQAVQVLEREVMREPNNAWTYQHLADAMLLSGDTDGYRGLFRDAMGRMKGSSNEKALVDSYANFLQRHKLASLVIENDDVVEDILLAIAVLKCITNHVYDEDPDSRNRLLELLPKIMTSHTRSIMLPVALRLENWGNVDEAALWFKGAADTAGEAHVLHQAITGLAKCGKFDVAYSVLDAGKNIDLNRFLDDSRLFEYLAHAPNRAEAEAYIDMFYEALPREREKLYAEIIWLSAIDERDAALERIERLAEFPDLPSRWLHEMASGMKAAGKCDAALQLTERIVAGPYQRSVRDSAVRQAVTLARCAGDYGKAFEYFAEATWSAPYTAGPIRKEFLAFFNEDNVQELNAAAARFITKSPTHPSVVEIIHLFSELEETGMDADAQSLLEIDAIPNEIFAALGARLNVIESWDLEAHPSENANGSVRAADLVGAYKAPIEPFMTTDDSDLPGALLVEQLADHNNEIGCLVARTEVDSASSKSVTATFGSCHQAASIWVNGEPVFKQDRHRGFNFDQNRFDVVLEQGTNEIVVQLYGPGNQGVFALGLLDDD